MANPIYLQYNNAALERIIGAFAGPQDYDFMVESTDDSQEYLNFLAAQQPSLASLMQAERDRLINYATLRINPLQDAVDIEEATDADVALLKKWKKFRADLGKVSAQAGWPDTIVWPVPPVPYEVSAGAQEELS